MEGNTYEAELQTETESLEILTGGEDFMIPVRVLNKGEKDLLDAEAVYLSYHISSLDEGYEQWDQKRFSINAVHGQEKTVKIVDHAPDQKGTYLLQLDIVLEGVAWLSQSGMEFPHILLKVLHDGSALLADLRRQIEEQKREEERWREALESGGYDLFRPYCRLDPFGRSPLTAILIFQTPEPASAAVHVNGKTRMACVETVFPEYTTRHCIPVYGLYPGKTTLVRIRVTDRSGRTIENQIEIAAKKLNHGFEKISLITYVKDERLVAPGFNFCYTGLEDKGMKFAYDVNGDIRWYFTDDSFGVAGNYRKSSSVWLCRQQTDCFQADEAFLYEHDLLGRIRSVYRSPYGVHHEILLTSDNIMFVPGNSEDVKYDRLAGIDLDTGEVVHITDYKQMLPRTRNISVVYSNTDWLHLNAVAEYQGDLIVSGNTQSVVLRHDREGRIKWMLGDPLIYGTYWKQFLLKPAGRNFKYPYNQHAVTILPDADGNPDTVDILLFDNGYSRYQNKKRKGREHPPYSRIVHYRINERKMTVRQIWEYGKERPELFSRWRGNAQLLRNGNRIGVFNVRQENKIDGKNYMEHCVAVEVDQKKHVLWECCGYSMTGRNSYQNYRIERKEIYERQEKNMVPGEEVKIRIGNRRIGNRRNGEPDEDRV